ncbi:MAG: hypothetical protein DRI56_03250 [Chloroflexota bacterium]|nr:MAG: hypothetical protein DRI56_03250 [Chloroflexota bacterium]
MYVAKAGVMSSTAVAYKVRKPAKLPPLGENEATEYYITALKPDAPIESVTLLGINFDKRVLPNAASLKENQGQYFEFGVLCRPLTKKQVEALWERAKMVDVRWRDKNTGELKSCLASELIILVKEDEYNPISSPSFYQAGAESLEINEPKIPEGSELKEVLMETQRKKGRNK